MARFRYMVDEAVGTSGATTSKFNTSSSSSNNKQTDTEDESDEKISKAAVSFLEVMSGRGGPRRRSRSNGSRIYDSFKHNVLFNRLVAVGIKNKCWK